MGVPNISAGNLREPMVPPMTWAPSRGAPDQAPKEETPSTGATEPPAKEEKQHIDPGKLSVVTEIRLRIDEETNRVIAQIVDENNELVRQIPPEEVLRVAEQTRQLLGLLFDESV